MWEREIAYCRLAESYLKEIGVWDKVQWGDVIEDQSRSGYRMDGVCMVGKNETGDLKVVPLSTEPDDYGTIPTEFYTPLFTPDAIYESSDPSFKDGFHYGHSDYVPVLPSAFQFAENITVSVPITRYNQTTEVPSIVAVYNDKLYIFPVPFPETFKGLTKPIYMEPLVVDGFENAYVLTVLYEPEDSETGEEFYKNM
jgi:hypothetical protein